MHPTISLIHAAIIAVILIGSLILQFVRWIGRGLRGLSETRPSPMTSGPSARPAADAPSTAMPTRPTPMAERPGAMPPRIAVDPAQIDASSAAFRAQEAKPSSPSRSGEHSRSAAKPLPEKTSSSSAEAEFGLFGSNSDFLRAIVLQQVLAPPLSRRNHPPRP